MALRDLEAGQHLLVNGASGGVGTLVISGGGVSRGGSLIGLHLTNPRNTTLRSAPPA
ncbi:hypothetical protein [Kribbella sp. DT2]|uniref:hypothetical protein n=1 Tax=Kribbella sp. DT2 TaxID=3393427 RepID=UPI003CFB8DCB